MIGLSLKRFRIRNVLSLLRFGREFAESVDVANSNLCWKCGSITSQYDLFCSERSCGVIQAITIDEEFDIFALYNLEPKYELDLCELDDKFRQLQTKLHPDKFATKSILEKNVSLQSSSSINQSYQV